MGFHVLWIIKRREGRGREREGVVGHRLENGVCTSKQRETKEASIFRSRSFLEDNSWEWINCFLNFGTELWITPGP